MSRRNIASDTSLVFISYHHNDQLIAETLHRELTSLAASGKGKDFIDVFLDCKNISGGMEWKPIINKNLADRDWLVAVYTGEESQFCGYEVGTFLQLHVKSSHRITTLHDVDFHRLPVILKDTKDFLVPPMPEKQRIRKVEEVDILAEEVGEWFRSTVGKFLIDFCDYKGLYAPNDESEDPTKYNRNIALAAKRIAAAFHLARGKDKLYEIPCQAAGKIKIAGIADGRIECIASNSEVFGTSLFFDILGLRLELSTPDKPSTNWGRLKELLQLSKGRDVPWMHKIESDVIRAVDRRTVSNNDVTFRGDNGKVYRPILERQEVFGNGDCDFYLVLVETLDRRFAGTPKSSLLLTALILASRWRFTYFEKWSDTRDRLFGTTVSLVDFAVACKQLFYNIEWIELEAAELGAMDIVAMVDAFGHEQKSKIEEYFRVWSAAKKNLYDRLPGVTAEIDSQNRAAATDAIFRFLDETGCQNDEFLKLALEAYHHEVMSHLSNEIKMYKPLN